MAIHVNQTIKLDTRII